MNGDTTGQPGEASAAGQDPRAQAQPANAGTPRPAPWPQAGSGGSGAPPPDPWPQPRQPQPPGPAAAPAGPWAQPWQPGSAANPQPDPWTHPQMFQQPGGYPGYPPGQFAGYQPPYFGPAARNNPFAITALVCGIAQFLLGLLVFGNILLAIPAIVFGAISLKQIRLRGERGRGMAMAGLILGILGVVYFALVVLGFAIAYRHSRPPPG